MSGQAPQAPTPADIANRLRAMASDMADVAALLGYYGGFRPGWADHARELAGASRIATGWAGEIEGGAS